MEKAHYDYLSDMKHLTTLALMLLLPLVTWAQNIESEIIETADTIQETPVDFTNIESMPIMPGCESLVNMDNQHQKDCFGQAVMIHVGQNFEYPAEAIAQEIQGRVLVYFIVEKDGSLSSFEVLRGVHPLLDEEALRVVKSLPHATSPAYVDGVPVRMSFIAPINAVLEEDGWEPPRWLKWLFGVRD